MVRELNIRAEKPLRIVPSEKIFGIMWSETCLGKIPEVDHSIIPIFKQPQLNRLAASVCKIQI